MKQINIWSFTLLLVISIQLWIATADGKEENIYCKQTLVINLINISVVKIQKNKIKESKNDLNFDINSMFALYTILLS